MGEFIPSPDARQQLLISKGEQQQLVWSVHLAGWLEHGWQVAPSPGQAAPPLALQQQVPVVAEPAAAARPPARRGRRAASREPVAPEPAAPGLEAPEFEQPLAASAADPLDGAAAESPLALPDDLFDDPLS